MNPQRSVRRAFSRDGTFASERPRGPTIAPVASEQRGSSPVHVDLEEFIDDLKLKATPHDRRALENAKNKLLNRHYRSHHIQRWKGDEYEDKWEKLGISPGIGRELADNVGAFERRKKLAGASTRVYSPPPVSTSRASRSILDSIEDEGYGHQSWGDDTEQWQEDEEFESQFNLEETEFA